jgi:hypothetical protein
MAEHEKPKRPLTAEEKRRARENARVLIEEAMKGLHRAQIAAAEARAYRKAASL